MDFTGRPYYLPAVHALIEPMEDGAWRGLTAEGRPFEIGPEAVAQAIEITVDAEGRGLYAVPAAEARAVRYRPDWKGRQVTVEGVGSMPADEFTTRYVRSGHGASAICSFQTPLHEQYVSCRAAKDGDVHCLDIADQADAIRGLGDPRAAVAAGMYDIVSSGMSDGDGFLDIVRRMNAGGVPIHVSSGLDEVLPGEWTEIRHFPQFMLETVRAVFGTYMGDLIGDVPIEDVSRFSAPAGTPLSVFMDDVAECVSLDPPFEGGNMIRGYRTSPVARYEGPGFGAIVFSDPAGSYVYAWRREPVNAPAGPGL